MAAMEAKSRDDSGEVTHRVAAVGRESAGRHTGRTRAYTVRARAVLVQYPEGDAVYVAVAKSTCSEFQMLVEQVSTGVG